MNQNFAAVVHVKNFFTSLVFKKLQSQCRQKFCSLPHGQWAGGTTTHISNKWTIRHINTENIYF